MFPVDVSPDTAALQSVPVLIAQATSVRKSSASNMSNTRTIGACYPIENPGPVAGGLTAVNALNPILATKNYLYGFENITVSGSAIVTVISPPKHGKLIDGGTVVEEESTHTKIDTHETQYAYQPDSGYVGKDTATFLVEIGGYKVTLVNVFEVAKEINDNDVGPGGTICPNRYWKISLNQDNVDPSAVAFGLPDAWSNQLLKNVNVSLNIASLPDGKLGETTGTSITLDDNGGA